jgi:predicted thioredoxin/glutaredoxin
MQEHSEKRVVVEIYVHPDCGNCIYAYQVAARIREDFPMVDVRLIDVAKPGQEIPESVFATPTYLLNGQRWSLGNPSPQAVQEVLEKVLTGASPL